MSTTTASPVLITAAWRLRGVFNEPGVLRFDGNRLSYREEKGVLFDVPASALDAVTFPWYYFNGGLKLTVGGVKYRFSFIAPDGAREPPAAWFTEADSAGATGKQRVADAVGALVADFDAGEFNRGRKAGKAWKAALGARS